MRRFIALIGIVAMAACGGDSSTGASVSAAGTYNLSSVNGAALPYVLQASGPKVELVGDVYVISSVGTFTQTTTLRVTSGTTVSTETVPDAGSYTQSGNTITLHYNSDASTALGTISGNTITMGESGLSAIYTKQ